MYPRWLVPAWRHVGSSLSEYLAADTRRKMWRTRMTSRRGAHVERTCVLRAWVVAYYWVSRSWKANPDSSPPCRILGTLPGPSGTLLVTPAPPSGIRARARAQNLFSAHPLFFFLSVESKFAPPLASSRTLHTLYRYIFPPIITSATISSAILFFTCSQTVSLPL